MDVSTSSKFKSVNTKTIPITAALESRVEDDTNGDGGQDYQIVGKNAKFKTRVTIVRATTSPTQLDAQACASQAAFPWA